MNIAPAIEPFDVFAVKYAEHRRTASSNFLGGDPHDGPMPMDYFIWVATNSTGTWVIDTGFNQATARQRGRDFIRCPAESLRMLGIDGAAVDNVIITHLHYDHVGNFYLFPSATYHLQDHEMVFATGVTWRTSARMRPMTSRMWSGWSARSTAGVCSSMTVTPR